VDILHHLNAAANLLDFRCGKGEAFWPSAQAAIDYLEENLYGAEHEAKAVCIGHTHVDVAWLWKLEQTREKTGRTFATMLKLMEEHPEFRFMSSQPQIYDFVKQDYPELYQRVKERVADGRWEAEGGMWLEADTNIPCGESLVRQLLFGQRFFRDEFGKDNFEIVYPSVSVLAEPPVAVVDKNVDERGTRPAAEAYLKFLYTPEAQDVIGQLHYRPRSTQALAKFTRELPPVPLFTVDESFGGWERAQKQFFGDGGVFDQLYKPAGSQAAASPAAAGLGAVPASAKEAAAK
jgi:hypothetical protein